MKKILIPTFTTLKYLKKYKACKAIGKYSPFTSNKQTNKNTETIPEEAQLLKY